LPTRPIPAREGLASRGSYRPVHRSTAATGDDFAAQPPSGVDPPLVLLSQQAREHLPIGHVDQAAQLTISLSRHPRQVIVEQM
jgi:hypothetical protein